MKRIAFLLLAASLTPATSLAQPGPSDPFAGPKIQVNGPAEPRPVVAADRRAMYEDIEIMRRLLSRTLSNRPSLTAQCTVCHTVNVGVTFNDVTVNAGQAAQAKNTAGPGVAMVDYDGDGRLDLYVTNSIHPHTGVVPFAIEGSYLRAYGVVYSLTLPAVGREELTIGGAAPSANRPSEWDSVRGEVRGDKAAPLKPVSKPTLLDAVLHVLAENGKHFAQLPANENLTLVFTFHSADTRPAGRRQGSMSAMMSGLQAGGGKVAPGAGSMGGATYGPNAIEGYYPYGDSTTPDRELELLAELHLKQGKPAEAADAYERAIAKATEGLIETNLPPSPVRTEANDRAKDRAKARIEGLTRKLAEVRLQMNDLDGARKALDRRFGNPSVQTKNVAPTQPVPTARVPGKLILTVSKRLLDQVGSGDMTFADFEKQVSIEIPDLDTSGRK